MEEEASPFQVAPISALASIADYASESELEEAKDEEDQLVIDNNPNNQSIVEVECTAIIHEQPKPDFEVCI